MNCFCGMVDRQKVFSLISSCDHHQGSSPSRIFSMPGAGLEPAQNLSSCFVERSCAVVITTTPQRHKCGPHRHKRCKLWSPLSFWVLICNRKKAHLHNSEPALKFFLVLAQGKAQEVHGNISMAFSKRILVQFNWVILGNSWAWKLVHPHSSGSDLRIFCMMSDQEVYT